MWYCNGCGRVRGGPECKKVCRDKWGDMGATRIPPLDGWMYINDDGSIIPRREKEAYDNNPFRRGQPYPKRVQGPRPPGWLEALEVIAARAARIIEEGVAAGIKLPCGED